MNSERSILWPSFPRKREPRASNVRSPWIPAFAGATVRYWDRSLQFRVRHLGVSEYTGRVLKKYPFWRVLVSAMSGIAWRTRFGVDRTGAGGAAVNGMPCVLAH